MTKSHPMHRKKAINMAFRHSYRRRRIYDHIQKVIDNIKEERGVSKILR